MDVHNNQLVTKVMRSDECEGVETAAAILSPFFIVASGLNLMRFRGDSDPEYDDPDLLCKERISWF